MTDKLIIVVNAQNDNFTNKNNADEIIHNICDFIKTEGQSGLTLFTRREGYNDERNSNNTLIKYSKGWQINDTIWKTYMSIGDNKSKPYHIIDVKSVGYPYWEDYLNEQTEVNTLNINRIYLVGCNLESDLISNAIILRASFPNADIQIVSTHCLADKDDLISEVTALASNCSID